jgi:hypothetical protein
MTPPLDSFSLTMSGLEAGLRVHHIAASNLKTCSIGDSLAAVLADASFADFDQIPVRDDSKRIVGVLLRAKNTDSEKVAEAMELLDESLLVSAEAPLMSFIRIAGTIPYKLVLNQDGIKGIVTRSDLLKLPVRLLAFAGVTHLESLMVELIRTKHKHGDDSWLRLLGGKRQEKIRWKEKKLRRSRMEIDLLELTDFCDKRELVRQIADPGPNFADDLVRAEDLRNQIAHAATFIVSDSDASGFALQLQMIEQWIQTLQQIGKERMKPRKEKEK